MHNSGSTPDPPTIDLATGRLIIELLKSKNERIRQLEMHLKEVIIHHGADDSSPTIKDAKAFIGMN